MNDLKKLVREALDGSRVHRSGNFVHNAAAVELLEHGTDAISEIENEHLALAKQGRRPSDIASVTVVYSQLLRKFDSAERAISLLQRLPSEFREEALGGVFSAWHLHFPTPGKLPEAVCHYLRNIYNEGSEKERHEAQRILQRDDKLEQ